VVHLPEKIGIDEATVAIAICLKLNLIPDSEGGWILLPYGAVLRQGDPLGPVDLRDFADELDFTESPTSFFVVQIHESEAKSVERQKDRIWEWKGDSS
jgi:hypothetical protein